MFRFLSSLVFIFFISGGVQAQDWGWKTFSPAGKSWSILAPGEMKPDAEALESSSKMGSYSYSDFYGYFAVVYRDAPKPFLFSLKPDHTAHFKKVKNDFITASKGQLLKEEEFSNGKWKGRELFIKIPSGTLTGFEGQTIQKYRIERLRMFFVGRRFFMLLAVLPEDVVNTPAVNKFFDSFSTNSAPLAVADSYATDEDTVLTINAGRGVLANDTDEEDDNLSVAKAETMPAHGTLALKRDGSFTYTPEANFNGTDSFTYKANDGQADSAEVTAIIKVNSVNDAPTISLSSTASTLDELTELRISADAADIDSPENALRFSLSEAPAGATIDPVSGEFRWTPSEAQGPANYTFRVNVSDGSATSSSVVNVTVREVNSAPQISNVPSSATVDELSPFSFEASALDVDIPNQTLTFSLISAPAGATINPSTGVFSWTPAEAQGAGDFPVTVSVTDNGSPALSAKLTFNIHVNEVNVAPLLAAIGDKTVDEETPLSFTAGATDSDLPANSLTYSLINAPAGASINPATGVFSWISTEAQGAGSYRVTVRVTDNGSPALFSEETVTIAVREVNKPPVARGMQVTGIEDKAVSFALQAGDADLPANTLSYSVVKAPVNGSLSGAGANLTYTPKPDFNGADSFTFKVSDGAADSATVTISLVIAPVNDAPVTNSDSAATQENVPVIINPASNDTDVDGDELVITGVSDAVGGSVEIFGGSVRFTPNRNFRGAGGFKYTISDGNGGTASGSVTVTVNPPGDGK